MRPGRITSIYLKKNKIETQFKISQGLLKTKQPLPDVYGSEIKFSNCSCIRRALLPWASVEKRNTKIKKQTQKHISQ